MLAISVKTNFGTNNEEIDNENSEIMTRMFDMTEKMTERFEVIEDQLWRWKGKQRSTVEELNWKRMF